MVMSASPYPLVSRWDTQIQDASTRVAAVKGIRVPVPVVDSIMQIESGGNPNVATPGAYGLMQVTAGTIGTYDLPRAQTDSAYGIWAGVDELANREKDSGGLPWDSVATGYFSGHYQATGQATDLYGTTDTEYHDRFVGYLADFGGSTAQVSNVTTRPDAALSLAIGQGAKRAGLLIIGLGCVGVALWSHHSA